jgi:OmpA-OmpF porin, OOP family
MLRKSFVVLLGAALAAASLGGCAAKAGGSLTAGAQTPPPAPPPPPPPPPAPAPAPAPPPPPKPKVRSAVMAKGGKIALPGNIVFDTGKSTLKEGAGNEDILKQLKEFLDQNPQITRLRIEGHTDNVGDPAANMELSGQRALTIKKWLVDHGIQPKRLLAVGFGQTKPIADNSTADGRAQNRRTEFHIAEIKHKKYLGEKETGGGKVFK